VGKILDLRRSYAATRMEQFREELKQSREILTNKACVYAIGSFGRCEASPHSDLDLFIAGRDTGEATELRRLDEILVKAELIEATRKLSIPEFSGDGEYLRRYSIDELVKTLGTPEDDVTNTFTARLLLLLESRPVVENTVYHDVIEHVVAAYWRDSKITRMILSLVFWQMMYCEFGERFA